MFICYTIDTYINKIYNSFYVFILFCVSIHRPNRFFFFLNGSIGSNLRKWLNELIFISNGLLTNL